LLRVLANHREGLTVSELAGELGTHRAGVYRLLGPHLRERLVWRHADGRFYLGVGLIELAAAVQPRLQELAGPLLQSLADELTVTTALTVRDGEYAAVVLDVRSPSHADLHITYRPGLRHPVSVAASGVAILAGGPERPTERPEVTEARHRGWAQSTGELLPGASGVAAPIRQGPGEVEAAISAVWIGERDNERMARAVIATADAIAGGL
jgi:DNA-binding IclR family transcriptional regulator